MPVLGVRDVKAAMDFYVRTLGFKPVVLVPGVNPNEGGVYGVVERNGAAIHLQIRRHAGNVEREAHEQDAQVLVGDLVALHDEYAGAGVTFVIKTRNGKTSTFGPRDFTVEDRDGNRICFASKEQQ